MRGTGARGCCWPARLTNCAARPSSRTSPRSVTSGANRPLRGTVAHARARAKLGARRWRFPAVNAVQQSLSSSSGPPPQDPAPLPPGAPAEGRPLDAWLLSKLSAYLGGDPSLEFAIKDGARVSQRHPGRTRHLRQPRHAAGSACRSCDALRRRLLRWHRDDPGGPGGHAGGGLSRRRHQREARLVPAPRAAPPAHQYALPARATTSIATTTSATSSTRCGSAARWPTRAPTTRPRRQASTRRRSPRWTTCAASCA